MENSRKSTGILISLIFGALFAMGIVTLWVFIIRDIIKYGGNFFNIKEQIKWWVLFIIITAGSLAGLVLNIIAWLKQKEKFVLVSGIAYIFGANLISAIICFVEYFDIKSGIKNKTLVYTALFSCLLAVLWIVLWIFTERMERDDSGMMPFWLFTSIAMGIGVLFNFLAWKFDEGEQKGVTGAIAGFFYILGIITVVPAIICFIRTSSYIKNKLLFYTSLSSCLFIAFLMVLYAAIPDLRHPYVVFMGVTMIIGTVFNFLAWKKYDDEKFRAITGVIAGAFYILGSITIIQAIICLIRTGSYIKNKLLFYASLFSCLFIVFWMVLYAAIPDFRHPYVVFMGVTMIIGTVFNFLAWKKYDDEKFRAITGVIAGSFYILGSITIIPAIICFIRTGSYIKNKLLFYTAVFSCLLTVFWAIIWIFVEGDAIGSIMPFVLFTSIAMGLGAVFNFLAWKTGSKKMKIIAGILYILGILTVIPAIICFICSRNKRKPAASGSTEA